jgi:hypothetical protein
MNKVRCLLGMLVLGCLFAQQVHGEIIALSSTGAGLAAEALDPHYEMSAGPEGSGNLYVVRTDGFPFPPWVANQGTSVQWIAPKSDYRFGQTDPPGIYLYRTTFDLTGFIPSTAILTGEWASDDCGEIWLNGFRTWQESGPPPGCSASMHPFTITTGFNPGINTLDFTVTNLESSPTGIIVSISGTASQVPEPATLTLTLLGFDLAGFWLLLRRNRKACQKGAGAADPR